MVDMVVVSGVDGSGIWRSSGEDAGLEGRLEGRENIEKEEKLGRIWWVVDNPIQAEI